MRFGTGEYKLADGSTQKSERLLLREVRIGTRVIKNVVANVAPVYGEPLLGQSFLSRLSLWTLDNSRHALILGDESIHHEQDDRKPSGRYKSFVQDGWLLSSDKLLSEGRQLILRRYGYDSDGGTFRNVFLFFCPKARQSYSVLDIVIPKNYDIKSFARDTENPKLGVRILTDNMSTWHFEADYKNGEMFIDRTPSNYEAFDAIMNGRELLIGFGVGDTLHYHLTPKMDAFMKEASAAVGSGRAELGNVTFLDRAGAAKLCQEFQTGKFRPKEESRLAGDYWVVRGTVSCPGCDPSKGKTSLDVNISKDKDGPMTSESECKKIMNTYRSSLMQKAQNVNLSIKLHCVKISGMGSN